MGVLHVEGLASHNGLESCVGTREGSGEALTGEDAGRVLSHEMLMLQGADAVEKSGRQHEASRHGERRPTLRGLRPLARVEATCTGTGISTGRPLGESVPQRSASERSHL
jgi:hypothetical protein